MLKKVPYASGSDLRRRGTSPPELIAAAHAGSFSMTLANELGEAGYHPRQIDTTATVTMEDIAAGWTMTQIYLDVIATVPKVAQCDFVDAALRAKANCPISRSLNANISMRATLSHEVRRHGFYPSGTECGRTWHPSKDGTKAKWRQELSVAGRGYFLQLIY